MITLIVWLFIIFVVLVIIGIVLAVLTDDCDVGWLGWMPAIIVLIIALAVFAHMGIRKHKIEVFNELYQTDYTVEQAFWAGDMIQTTYEKILVGEKTRQEIEAEIKIKMEK